MATQLLKTGVKGELVKELQSKLQKLGFESTPDGAFGPNTKGAVEELQTLFGYNADGIVGDGTLKLIEQQLGLGFNLKDNEALKRAIEAGTSQAPKHALKKGSEGGDVRFVQRRLVLLGYSVPVDGKFSETTEQAVRSLQQAFKYDVDGMVGEATHKLLNQQIGLGWRQAVS